MTSHTPGPWSVPHFAEPDVNCECRYVLCDHMMGAVATVHCSGEGEYWERHGDNPKFKEACANARLIAAAPDLFEYVASSASAGCATAAHLIEQHGLASALPSQARSTTENMGE